MTDKDTFLQILDNQDPEDIAAGNWDKIKYTVEKIAGVFKVDIIGCHISFLFNIDGRFYGIINSKQ